MNEKLYRLIGEHGIGRFRLLLLAILLMIGLRPFLDGLIAISLITDISFSGILVTGVYALSKQRWSLGMAWCLATVIVLVRIAQYFVDLKSFDLLVQGMSGLFLVQMLVMILWHIRTETEITADLLMGAICGYLLMGVVWAYVYNFLELVHQHSFNGVDQFRDIKGSYLYYSFVTLTTVGFGDITPATQQARALSIIEAIFGQLYLAILIGRLVGLHAAQLHEGKIR